MPTAPPKVALRPSDLTHKPGGGLKGLPHPKKAPRLLSLGAFLLWGPQASAPINENMGMDSQQPWPQRWRRFQHWWVAVAAQVQASVVPAARAAPLPFLHDAQDESPEFVRAVTLIRAIDAGGVPLNPMRVNDIARKLGLEVSGAAPMEETIERIRARLLDTHAGATAP